jgi:hypothetical protein
MRLVAAKIRSAGSPCSPPGNLELSTAISGVRGIKRRPGANRAPQTPPTLDFWLCSFNP